MSRNSDYLNNFYGKHTVALEFLAEAGIKVDNNVINSPKLGTNLAGVGSNPGFLRLNTQTSFNRYPIVLQSLAKGMVC